MPAQSPTQENVSHERLEYIWRQKLRQAAQYHQGIAEMFRAALREQSAALLDLQQPSAVARALGVNRTVIELRTQELVARNEYADVLSVYTALVVKGRAPGGQNGAALTGE